jgi:hypothetical protein
MLMGRLGCIGCKRTTDKLSSLSLYPCSRHPVVKQQVSEVLILNVDYQQLQQHSKKCKLHRPILPGRVVSWCCRRVQWLHLSAIYNLCKHNHVTCGVAGVAVHAY